MHNLYELVNLLETFEKAGIYYELGKIRDGAILINVAVPGEHWEIEFNTYGDPSHCSIEIEKFKSDGVIYGEEELETLFRDFSD